ncbi:MAG: 3-oxoadipate enol-lactonase [Mesorhizobium sp.]
MQFIRANGVVLHVEDSGGDKPVVVFSNSLGTDFRIWDDVVAALRPHCRVIRYDKRGHGLSEATPAPYSINDHVGDLAALLDHLGVTQAAIVGLSVGGIIAQGLAAARPDLVKAVVLSNTAHRVGTTESWNARIEAVTANGLGSIADNVMKLWFTPEFHENQPEKLAGCRSMMSRTPLEGYAGTCAALRDADMTASTRALTIPALCIGGDQDGSTPPALVRSLAELIPGAQFEIIPQSGHIPCVEQPDAHAALILQFLKSIRHVAG